MAEHFLGKEKVVGSILTIGSEQNKNNNMAKKKKRSKLVCQECKKTSYFTNKTKAVEEKLEMSKFCKECRKHATFKEVKK